MKNQIRFRVHGRVQRVRYRESTVTRAQELDIVGWVANCADGTVEGVAQGEEDDLVDFEIWLHLGPPKAEVYDVDKKWESAGAAFTKFTNGRPDSVQTGSC